MKNQTKLIMKVVIAILLQFPLIVLATDLALSDLGNKTQIEAKQLNSTIPLTANEVSTILEVDKNTTTKSDETVALNVTTTALPTSTTTDDPLVLIPPATVEAQIVKANISSKKPSRLQAAA